METPAVLFVCLGNICRSPMAEGAFRKAAQDAGVNWLIDSAGTGNWHIGNSPDERAQATALMAGIDISGLRARQVAVEDFDRFTHIFAMDAKNLADLQSLAPEGTRASISLLLSHVPGRALLEVGDPYFGGQEGFDRVWNEVTLAAQYLVDTLPR